MHGVCSHYNSLESEILHVRVALSASAQTSSFVSGFAIIC